MKDSVIDRAHVINQAFSIEKLRDPEMYNQVSSKEMFAFFEKGEIHEAQAVDNVIVSFYPEDEADSSYILNVYMETSKLRMFMKDRKLDYIWSPKSDGMAYPLTQIPQDKRYLEGFAWFDYVRPVSRDDVFHWRGKKHGTELKALPQRRKPTLDTGNKPPASAPSRPVPASNANAL